MPALPAARVAGQPGRGGKDTVRAKKKHPCRLAVQRRKRLIPAVEPTCQHTKGRHHQPRCRLHETGTPQPRTAMTDHAGGMVMRADLGTRIGLVHDMPEDDPAFFMQAAAAMARRHETLVMIALDPDRVMRIQAAPS
jgi:hypothetical protein